MRVQNHSKARRKGGQAIIMVTLALIAMAAMMGLAVDLGWSYFVQKQAQAAADAAALAAVQQTYAAMGGTVGTVTCTSGGNSDCVTNVACSAISTGNLYSGCLYAARNGFTSGVQGSRQEVTMTSGNAPPIPTVPDVTDVKYWVTVRTVQTIPQLFSAVLGNAEGTVSAIATAAVAAQVIPGSFYGLNQKGDCLSNAGGLFNCGVDVDISGSGQTNCVDMNGNSTGNSAKVCAPSGMYLASQCNGTAQQGCGSGSITATGSNWAGQTQGNSATAWSGTGIQITGQGEVNDPTNWRPTPTNGSGFQDPTLNKPQPPLLVPNSPLPTCGVLNGNLPSGAVLGPYQYYAYTMVNGVATPSGAPITLGNNASVTFSSSGTCPTAQFPGQFVFTAGATQVNGTFPVTIIYGGLNINGNVNTSVTFGAGQYVMAGTVYQTDSNQTPAATFNLQSGSVTGDSSTGTNFIITDASYNGALNSQTSAASLTGMPTLYQGYVQIKNNPINLTGPTASAPSTLTTDHKNVLFWQDRRNSNIDINPNTGVANSQNLPPAANHRTPTSAKFALQSGNTNLRLKGVYYQPRGAWLELQSGTAAVSNSPLQILTGALYCPGGCGNAAIVLQGPTAPFIKYVASLIQ